MILNKYNWVTYQPNTMADVPQDYIDQEVITLLPLQIRSFMVSFNTGNTEEIEIESKPMLKEDFIISDA